jgi:hypothetical protein
VSVLADFGMGWDLIEALARHTSPAASQLDSPPLAAAAKDVLVHAGKAAMMQGQGLPWN